MLPSGVVYPPSLQSVWLVLVHLFVLLVLLLMFRFWARPVPAQFYFHFHWSPLGLGVLVVVRDWPQISHWLEQPLERELVLSLAFQVSALVLHALRLEAYLCLYQVLEEELLGPYPLLPLAHPVLARQASLAYLLLQQVLLLWRHQQP